MGWEKSVYTVQERMQFKMAQHIEKKILKSFDDFKESPMLCGKSNRWTDFQKSFTMFSLKEKKTHKSDFQCYYLE